VARPLGELQLCTLRRFVYNIFYTAEYSSETDRRATNCADAALRRRRRTAADTDTELSERQRNVAISRACAGRRRAYRALLATGRKITVIDSNPSGPATETARNATMWRKKSSSRQRVVGDVGNVHARALPHTLNPSQTVWGRSAAAKTSRRKSLSVALLLLLLLLLLTCYHLL